MTYHTSKHFSFQFFFLPLVLFSYHFSLLANIRIPEPLTTRLQSTSGAGVASLLIDEATVLNPAPMAFYTQSFLYYHYNKTTIFLPEDDTGPSPKDSKGMSVIASDGGQKTKGSFNYTWLNHDRAERKRFSFATGFPVSKTSSMGMTYRYTIDRPYQDGEVQSKEKSHQVNFGIYHMVAPYLSLGMVFTDPFKANDDDTVVIAGAQLSYKDMIVLMTDFGANYHDELSSTFLYRTGLQLKVFSDFLLRFGMHKDNGLREKGSAFGLAWISPRLALNFALRHIEVDEWLERKQREEKIKELSFSMSVHF